MNYQSTFKRYEIKYLLNDKQKEEILSVMNKYMKIDEFGRTTIRNIYYDTENYRLIRNSLEKPIYKEKLRIRSYKKVNLEDEVFVELKKKYKSVVYKRRILMPDSKIENDFYINIASEKSQIANEIEYFMSYYKNLKPIVFLSYEREAYYSLDRSDFRVTFDENILYRDDDLSLTSEVYGKRLIDENQTLMEVKTSGGMPMWMIKILNKNKIFKTSFSKYGAAYKELKKEERGKIYA